MRKLLLPLLILSLLLCGCSQSRTAPSYSLSLWYASDAPLGPALEALAEDYNAGREKDALPVALRSFDDEAALFRALESGAVPDLLLCTHSLAFSLDEKGLLKTQAQPSPAYPDWLSARSDCVGRRYYPLGFSLPLLCAGSKAPAELSALLRAAAQHAEGDPPLLSVDSFAALFCQVMLDAGVQFTGKETADRYEESYVNLYNALAEAVFAHGLRLEAGEEATCRIGLSPNLRRLDLSGCEIRALSDGMLLAEGYGLAVTSREPRTQGDVPRFLRWLLTPARTAKAALSVGLLPALETELVSSEALDTALLSLSSRPLYLPEADSQYYVNRSAFDARLRAALELLD